MCSCLGKGSRNAQKTPGGLIFRQRWNNMQFVTSASFLMTVYSDYLTSAGKSLRCANGNISPSELLSFAKSQVKHLSWIKISTCPFVWTCCKDKTQSICSWNYRWTTFLGITHEPRATWSDMVLITPNKCTTGVRLLFRTRWIPRLLPAEEGMPPGLAGKEVILIFLLVPLLEALMLMIILPIKETTTSKLSRQLITMLHS